MSKIGIGLIGCGGRLRGVVHNLHKATDLVEVKALFDPNEHSITAARDISNPQATACVSYQELLGRDDISWVMIGSWNAQHAEHAIAAFNAGKHVFCEKPLATTLDDCLAMRDAWRKSGKHFVIGFTLRYSPHYVKIKQIIDSGAIGKIVSLEFNETLEFNHGGFIHGDWRRKTAWAGSHMLEKCCHDVDLINWMVGSTAVKAASFGGCDFFTPENAHYTDKLGTDEKGRKAFQVWRHGLSIKGNVGDPFNDDKDIVDNQVAILQFANGVRASFHTNCCTGIPERRMYICGTEGTIQSDVLTGKIHLQKIGFNTLREDVSTGASGGHGDGDPVLAERLAATMINDAPSQSTLEDGLRSAITVFGIDEAHRSGQVADISPLWEKAEIGIK